MFHLRCPYFIALAVVTGLAVHGIAAAQTGGNVQIDHLSPGASGAGADVSTFTGAFSFSLPLLTVPGPHGSDYTISLGYNSDISPEAGASWVGYGWSLNPGAIVRGTKGYPDDWKGTVKLWNKQRRNWTVTAALKGGLELASLDLPGLSSGKIAASRTIRYNNNKGYAFFDDFSLSATGIGSVNYKVDDVGNETFTTKVSPSLVLRGIKWGMDVAGISLPQDGTLRKLTAAGLGGMSKVGAYALSQAFTFKPDLPQAMRVPSYHGRYAIYSAGMTITTNPFIVIGPDLGIAGTYTWQETEPVQSLDAFGSMYSYMAGESDLLDYMAERDGEYKRDHAFLPIPFAGTDDFLVTGDGSGGVFRLVSRRTGIFHPNYVHNQVDVTDAEPELTLGLRWGFGFMQGFGRNSMKIGRWNDDGENNEYTFEDFSDSRTAFFRFFGDPQGNVIRASSDNAVAAAQNDDIAEVPSDILPVVNEGRNVGRGTHIGFNLNRDLLKITDKGVPYRAYGKDQSLLGLPWMERDEEFIEDQIGEICITGEGGGRYIYGLPVYARNEQELALGLAPLAETDPGSIRDRSIAFAPITAGSAAEVQGTERSRPYASSYLLTLITSPDYVDLRFDGPTPDDLGGYVKFNYERTAGSVSKNPAGSREQWFHWRSPYTGLYYDRRDLSDKTDDAGAYSAGEHEMYYVESIETKTHIAIFVNNRTDRTFGSHHIQGSGRERMDAYQAPYMYAKDEGLDYEATAAGDSAASDAGWIPQGEEGYRLRENMSRYLERIELYTKDANGEPDSLLTTVHLEYDYSLRKNMPNSATPHPDSTTRNGMLALRRVWMQHQRIYSARISPYIFNYEYRRSADFPANIRNFYPEITSFADSLGPAELENPDYDRLGLDPWGANQPDGAGRRANGRTWLSQTPGPFDPAAWHLKVIRTPSQGEILVQYEPRDYAYVQNRPAQVMTSLRASLGEMQTTDGDDNRYWINLADLGIADTSRLDVMRYASLLQRQYGREDERAYFKFLYALVGTEADFDAPGNTSGYINGHAKVDAITVDSVLVGSDMTYGISLRLKSEGTEDRMPDVPKRVCQEYVKTSKRGKLRDGDPIRFTDDGPEMIWALKSKFSEAVFHPEHHCNAIEFEHSYIRLPAYHAKMGGGARVKRLLTYARDSLNGSVLYGTEYDYSAYDEERREYISSGVAVNEPALMREENALVRPVFPAGKEDVRKKIIAGPDRVQYEGPLGESLLPGPSVGYRRVVAKNIHNGATNPGFSVTEFLTAREYPFLRYMDGIGNSVAYTGIQVGEEEESPLWGLLGPGSVTRWLALGYHHNKDRLDLTQGYRFILNSMHGRLKRSASYGGVYGEKGSWALSALQEYVYAEPGEKIRINKRIGDHMTLGTIGKEMDVAIESRTLDEHTIDVGAHGDISFPSAWPPVPSFSISAWGRDQKTLLNMQSISKVIRYPAIVRGVLTYGDGMYHYTEHRVFDSVTGRPVISRTVDGFDHLTLQNSPDGHVGMYHSYQFLAHTEHDRMGQKALNERIMLSSEQGIAIDKTVLSGGRASLTISSSPVFLAKQHALALLSEGDLLHLTRESSPETSAGFYHVDGIDGDVVSLIPVSESLYAAHNSYTGPVRVEVLSSGRANQTGTPVGTIITYGERQGLPESAANITRDLPQDAFARKAFADSLNFRLHNFGGVVLPSQIQSMGLKFIQTFNGVDTCLPLSDTLHLAVGPELAVLSFGHSSPICIDTFTIGSRLGGFEIDEYSRLVYRPGTDDLPVQPVGCLRFCPDEVIPRTRSMEGVIAAGAVVLSDTMLYDPADYPAIPDDANRFESGVAGRWNARTGYTYRTAVAGGSQHYSSERSYNSGTFDSFTLFDWQTPEFNDTLFWLRSDRVTRHSPHGDVLESQDPLGLYSAVKLGYGDRLPILVASNAEYESVGFQDFERYAGSGLVRGTAHSGRQSVVVNHDGTLSTGLEFKLTEQARDMGVLVRFWMATSRDELPSDGVGFLSVGVSASGGNDYLTGLAPQHRIARSGEWTLYEVVVEGITEQAGTDFEVVVSGDPGSDTAMFDDIRVQPYDAAMQCHVYDSVTLRPLAMFDDDHFGIYPQYNAEGRVVRSIVETGRGFRTVAESHAHMPSILRTSDIASQSMPQGMAGTSGTARRTRSVEQPPPSPLNGRFDLLDVEIAPDKRKIDVLGGRNGLPDIDDLPVLRGADSADLPDHLPKELERFRWLKEIRNIDERLNELERNGMEEGAENADAEAAAEIRRLREQRSALMRSLGLNEEDLQRELGRPGSE